MSNCSCFIWEFEGTFFVLVQLARPDLHYPSPLLTPNVLECLLNPPLRVSPRYPASTSSGIWETKLWVQNSRIDASSLSQLLQVMLLLQSWHAHRGACLSRLFCFSGNTVLCGVSQPSSVSLPRCSRKVSLIMLFRWICNHIWRHTTC